MSDLFSRYVNSENISFKHAKGISDRSGKEFHLFHEIILFLGGEAELVSETVHTKLKPQTLIVIPKETYHQVIIKGKQDEYCRCVFQFYEGENAELIKNGMQEIFITESDKNTMYLFKKMMRLAENPNKDSSAIISQSVLNLLLDEIKAKKTMEIDKDLNDDLTKLAIEYISQRLTENLNVEQIAKHLNVSPSTLMHTFKKNMNIPLHKYIIKKRLILAHTKISNGEQAITVANECGFNDYSGFYKQYIKMFDITPSNRTRK
ncbi:MAG: helix-turn-helix transcriptional regulator [Clostridia bacterium]|nr:helix-turn-helix transcriptional regulator [Clostridia bacterium]